MYFVNKCHVLLHDPDVLVLVDVRILLQVFLQHIDRLKQVPLLVAILLLNLTIHLDLSHVLRAEPILELSSLLH